jgi:hypothetical protein
MTRKEARAAVPKFEVKRLVGAYHVGESPDVIAARIGKLCDASSQKMRMPELAARRWRAACIEYAKRVHASNLKAYMRVMRGTP